MNSTGLPHMLVTICSNNINVNPIPIEEKNNVALGPSLFFKTMESLNPNILLKLPRSRLIQA